MPDFQSQKKLVRMYYAALQSADSDNVTDVLASYLAPDHLWRGFHPFNEISGIDDLAREFWGPLKQSLQRMQRRMDIFIAGENFIDDQQTTWVVSMGHLMGLFDSSWIGIRPTGKIAMLRYCEFLRIENGRIAETAMFFDIPHLMIQAGQNPFGPQTGASLVQPGPATHDGLCFEDCPAETGTATMAAINAMVGDIATWSGGKSEPLVEELARTWNDDMIWWGPAGIGASYTIERYADQHSGPFRAAFVDRTFNGHVAKIAEGHFGGFFGWPNLTLTNRGGFMGMPASGKAGEMRVIDMYRREGDKLTENWIFIDLLHFWNMQGVDLLKRTTAIDSGQPTI